MIASRTSSAVHRLICGGAIGALLVLSMGAGPATSGSTVRVSVSSTGVQGNSFSANRQDSISADGRFVAFGSAASNLVPGDTNRVDDIFVRDRMTHQTTRVSVTSAGRQVFRSCFDPSISADGRFVAFASKAARLVPGDTNEAFDVFIHDRGIGATRRVSVSSAGTQGNDISLDASISADGRFVAFGSIASNLVAGDTNGAFDVFLRDRQAHTTTRISVSSDGAQANTGSAGISISEDGRVVAFDSLASNLVPGDTNHHDDVFVRLLQFGVTKRVSVSSTGLQGNGDSLIPALSANGRFVAFESNSSNLAPGDTNQVFDVFVRDRLVHTTRRVSVSSTGQQSDEFSGLPAISGDGRFVAFESSGSNLVPPDTNGVEDVFLRDREEHSTTRVSVSSAGAEGDGHSFNATISSDGKWIGFSSGASTLVSGDTNQATDVFVHGPVA